jgi:hypothetical protein
VPLSEASDPIARRGALASRLFEATLESLHDMSRPVDVLRACRQLRAPGGSVLVVDERVAGAFGAPGDQVERVMYGFSVSAASRPGWPSSLPRRPAR